VKAFLLSFVYAWRGIVELFRSQRNPRVQLFAFAIAIGAGVFLKLDRIEWALVIVCGALVLTAEALNTAIEFTVDLASPEKHELARKAKDCAAGAALIASLGAAAVGVILFGPKFAALSFSH
jgi:diacylglycerol kinase (ATP)